MALSEKLTDIKSQITSLLSYANDTTGEADVNLGDAVLALCEGFGQGGEGGGYKLTWNKLADITDSTSTLYSVMSNNKIDVSDHDSFIVMAWHKGDNPSTAKTIKCLRAIVLNGTLLGGNVTYDNNAVTDFNSLGNLAYGITLAASYFRYENGQFWYNRSNYLNDYMLVEGNALYYAVIPLDGHDTGSGTGGASNFSKGSITFTEDTTECSVDVGIDADWFLFFADDMTLNTGRRTFFSMLYNIKENRVTLIGTNASANAYNVFNGEIRTNTTYPQISETVISIKNATTSTHGMFALNREYTWYAWKDGDSCGESVPSTVNELFHYLADEFGGEYETTLTATQNGTDVTITHELGRIPTEMFLWAEFDDSEVDTIDELANIQTEGYVMSYVRNGRFGQDNFDNRTYIFMLSQYQKVLNDSNVTSLFDLLSCVTKTYYNATPTQATSTTVTIRNGTNRENRLMVNRTYHVLLK